MWGTFYLLLSVFAMNFGQLECNFFESVLTFLTAPQEPEKKMTAPEMIAYHGYPVETHNVTTEDGYILSLHRIPIIGKHGPSPPLLPVIIQHGFLASSTCWVWSMRGKNLPELLADEGYDVWITNTRGNEYGRNHTTLDPNKSDFWKFSWAEMATYDMPTIIDYVLRTTGAEKVTYVGHSMGTTIVFALLATKPEYNEKIKAVFALSPITIITHLQSVLRSTSSGWPLTLLKAVNHGETPFHLLFPHSFLDTVCAIYLTSPICVEALFAVVGKDWSQFNQPRVDLILRLFPTTSSVQTLEHYGQLILSKSFSMFDYQDDNQKIYNQSTPPEYKLDNIEVPVALFWGANDLVSTPEDVSTLPPKLKNVVLNHKVDWPEFSHGDFVYAIDVVPLLYEPLIAAIKKYAS